MLRIAMGLMAALGGLCMAAGAQASAMPLGGPALPPTAYVAFCEKQPADCGADVARVLAGAAQARAERAELAGMATVATGSLPPAAPDLAAEPRAAGSVRLDPMLWGRLNGVNHRINKAIKPQTDLVTYGREDVWATPLESGVKAGDCEDYVLEKVRALVEAGVPRSDLDIAVAQLPNGEVHAVLLVETSGGEMVLDNLTDEIRTWDETPYRWVMRQVGGAAFDWVRVLATLRQNGR